MESQQENSQEMGSSSWATDGSLAGGLYSSSKPQKKQPQRTVRARGWRVRNTHLQVSRGSGKVWAQGQATARGSSPSLAQCSEPAGSSFTHSGGGGRDKDESVKE